MSDSLQFKMDIPNLDRFVAAFQSAPSIVQPILQRTLAASQAILAKFTGQNTPYKSGYLATHFEFVPEPLRAHWIPRAKYALYVEQGTGIYGPGGARIVPKTKQALYWKGADHPVRSVSGMRGRHYMEKIQKAAQPEITKLFDHALEVVGQAIADQAK